MSILYGYQTNGIKIFNPLLLDASTAYKLLGPIIIRSLVIIQYYVYLSIYLSTVRAESADA